MMESLFGLADKRILVIGGGQGMGEATVRLLTALGCGVAVMDLELGRAERLCAELAEQGASVFPIAADVLKEADLVQAIARTEREFGPLDGLATIVGMAGWSPAAEMTTELWDQDHNRNLRYVFIAAREVGRAILARGGTGSIVAVASVDGMRSARNHAAYGAAKAGLINLVRSLAVEWSGRGIRVNCVAPGPIVTPRLPLQSPDKEQASMALIPMQRRGVTDDIAKAITFFLSDMSPFVTGQTLAVDGGFCAADVFVFSREVKPGATMGVDDAAA